jgi:hypothetical protein
MLGKIASAGIYNGVTIETALDPKVQPFLYDHRIEGTPVLPGVMGIEAFAEAAKCLAAGWTIESIDDINFLAPFKFYRNEPRTVTVRTIIRAEGDGLVATCALVGSRLLPNQSEPHETTHFTARVRLTKSGATAATAPSNISVPRATGAVIDAREIYRVYFHGAAYQVVQNAWRDGNRIISQFTPMLPNNHVPADRPTSVAPRLIELCFQTAGLWEMGMQSRMGLPLHVDRVTAWQASDSIDGPVHAVVEPSPDGTNFTARVVDAAGTSCLELSGYRTVTFNTDTSAMQGIKAVISGQLVTA